MCVEKSASQFRLDINGNRIGGEIKILKRNLWHFPQRI